MPKRRKKRVIKGIISCICIAIISLLGIGAMNETKPTYQENVVLTGNAEDFLKIYFFDVGQADSILITHNHESVLIDAGTNEMGETVVQNLKNLGITKLNYIIGTHPHEDHIGGLDDVIENFAIEHIYMPKVQTNTKTFEDVLDAVIKQGMQIETPEVGKVFTIGEVECEIMQCGTGTKEEQENLNLSSIVLRATYGEQSYLFMGDSETENEQARKWEKTNVLKVGHHGSDTSTSEEFLKQVSPQIAIISVGKDNHYGHPSEEIIKRLEKEGISIYRTDEKGTIVITSDGKQNQISWERK